MDKWTAETQIRSSDRDIEGNSTHDENNEWPHWNVYYLSHSSARWQIHIDELIKLTSLVLHSPICIHKMLKYIRTGLLIGHVQECGQKLSGNLCRVHYCTWGLNRAWLVHTGVHWYTLIRNYAYMLLEIILHIISHLIPVLDTAIRSNWANTTPCHTIPR